MDNSYLLSRDFNYSEYYTVLSRISISISTVGRVLAILDVYVDEMCGASATNFFDPVLIGIWVGHA